MRVETTVTYVRAVAISLGLALAGCGGVAVGYQPTTTAVHSAHDAAAVTIYTLPPSRPYTVVGYLRARQQGWGTASGPDLLAAMRDEAARRGCDAVVVDHGYCVEEPEQYSLRSATASLLVASCVRLTGAR